MAVPENDTGLLITADRNRKTVFEVRIGESDGDDVTLATGDKVRVKIGRGKSTPVLEFSSSTAASSGSTCTAANPTTITLEAGDVTFKAGIYDIEVVVIDASESNAPKKCEMGVFVLRESMGGVVT